MFSRPAARDWDAPPLRAHAKAFHASLPGYRATPLVELPRLAAEFGVARVLVKDEGSRLGLPAFKVLGASWACARAVAERDRRHRRSWQPCRRPPPGRACVW